MRLHRWTIVKLVYNLSSAKRLTAPLPKLAQFGVFGMHYLAGAFSSACRPFQAVVTGAPAAAEAPSAAAPTPAAAAEAPPPTSATAAAPTSANGTDAATAPQPPQVRESGPVTPAAAFAALEDEELLSRYELGAIIGRGGYSVVWRGTELASGGSDGGDDDDEDDGDEDDDDDGGGGALQEKMQSLEATMQEARGHVAPPQAEAPLLADATATTLSLETLMRQAEEQP